MEKETFSIKQIQDLVIEEVDEPREKKTIYATDNSKCPRGVYYSLKGEIPTKPIDPESLRRMETGKLIEGVQIRKLRSLGILIEAEGGSQHRAFNEKYNVSGRIDALVISPDHCTKEAKEIIKRKKEIYKTFSDYRNNRYEGLKKFTEGTISKEQFLAGKMKLVELEDKLYSENSKLNKKLLIPDPKNQLMIVEVKSSNEWGFKYYIKENKPNESHENQTLFYLSEFMKKYPNITARILYVAVPYQELLEFNVPFDTERLKNLRKFWTMMNDSLKTGKLPPIAPDVIQNEETGTWRVNYQAEWCRYHDKCTGDPAWFEKAKHKVISLNLKKEKPIKKVEKKIIKKSK